MKPLHIIVALYLLLGLLHGLDVFEAAEVSFIGIASAGCYLAIGAAYTMLHKHKPKASGTWDTSAKR